MGLHVEVGASVTDQERAEDMRKGFPGGPVVELHASTSWALITGLGDTVPHATWLKKKGHRKQVEFLALALEAREGEERLSGVGIRLQPKAGSPGVDKGFDTQLLHLCHCPI